MTPKQLLIGASLLWSSTPLAVSGWTGAREEDPKKMGQPLKDIVQLLNTVRKAVGHERDTECQYVVRGLVEMFDRGDKRVIPFRRICDPNYYLGSYSRPHLCEARVIVQTHFDLYDEALAVGQTFNDVFTSDDYE